MSNDFVLNCIGDSHANFFSGYDEPQPEWPSENINHRYPFLRCYRLGPVLAYNLGLENTTTMGREKLQELLNVLQPGSKLLFCFGEIDCRAHIQRQAEKQNRSYQHVTSEVVQRYFSTILDIQNLGFECLVWNVVPSAPSDINDRILVASQFLFHGTNEQRNQITQLFNDDLKMRCQKEKIPFLSIFNQLFNSDGTVNRDYYCDEIHLGQKAMPMFLKQLCRFYPHAPIAD